MARTAKDLEIVGRSTSIMDSLNVLKGGSQLWKIRDKGHLRGFKFYSRNYSLSLDDLTVCYSSSDGNLCPASAGGRIQLEDICEVRCGHGTDAFNALVKGKSSQQIRGFEIGGGKEPVDVSSSNCFSILFKEDHRPSLDLVAMDDVHRNCWVDCLSHLVVTIQSLGRQKEHETHLRKMFRKGDKNDNGMLTLSECQGLCQQLNMKMDASTVEDLFHKANKRNAEHEEEALDETEFVTFYYGLLQRPEIDKLFFKFASSNDSLRMTPQQLATFLLEEQRVELTVEECNKLVAAYEPSEEGEATSLSVEGFTQFILFSEWQNVTRPFHHRTVYQDMTRPLSHYWIASSHNTYLIGNQVTSDSSVEAYIKTLKEGCRCVELDCWDGDDGEPIIYHGWTMTSKISFKEVIDDAIRPYAFAVSDYPLILSIENHCSVQQQEVMADHLKTILGDVLFSDPVDQSLTELPSPEQLKRKVLIKAKKLGVEENCDDDEGDIDDERDEKRKVSPKNMSRKLSDLVNYVEAVHFHGFDEPRRFYQMSSFGESKAFGYFEDPEASSRFVTYNCRQLSRIYPGARRQDSSNFNPLAAWNCGCQIVAFNYQTDDKQKFLNRAKFFDNGRCGYVLKPEFMTAPDPNYSPLHSGKMTETLSRTMLVTVISGQHIPRPDFSLDGDVIDPYVKVRIRGHPDEKANKKRTQRVKNNGFNPIWNEKFRFNVSLPSLAFLELRVKDHSKSGPDKDLAAFCCPFNMLQQGYRRVPLRTYGGRDLSPACLLVKIEFEN